MPELARHKERPADPTRPKLEFQAAARVAHLVSKTVRERDRDRAVRALHHLLEQSAGATSTEDQLLRLNLGSALSFLAPHAMVPHDSADVSANGTGLSFSPPDHVRSVEGQLVTSHDGYGVSGIPSLSDVLADDKRGARAYRVIRRSLPPCSALLETHSGEFEGDANSAAARLGLTVGEGRPHDRFVRAAVQKTRGGFEAIYATNCVYRYIDHRGDRVKLVLGKVDSYDKAGKFAGSRRGWYPIEEQGADIRFDPQEFARKWFPPAQ